MIRCQYTRTNGEVRTYVYEHLQRNKGRALQICREALQKGPMVFIGTHWLHDRRFFSLVTVNTLIVRGEAIRDCNEVRAA